MIKLKKNHIYIYSFKYQDVNIHFSMYVDFLRLVNMLPYQELTITFSINLHV
jgi:hypothetical protein